MLEFLEIKDQGVIMTKTAAEIDLIFKQLHHKDSPVRQVADWGKAGRFSPPPPCVVQAVEFINTLPRSTSLPADGD